MQMTYAEAIQKAQYDILEQYPESFICGVSVADHKAIYGTCEELVEKFGSSRVFDTPISEDSMTGMCIGASLKGLKPIHIHMRMDFMLLAMNQIVNMGAKIEAMSGHQYAPNLTVRVVIGRGWGQGAQHSQALYSMLSGIPGIRVAIPSCPNDAYWCLYLAAVNKGIDIIVEHRRLYDTVGSIETARPLFACSPRDRVVRQGTDITIIALSQAVTEAVKAATALEKVGISAAVVDPVYINSIFHAGVSAQATKKVIIVEPAWATFGVASDIALQLTDLIKDINLITYGCKETVCPTSPFLEEHYYPAASGIAIQARHMVDGTKGWIPEIDEEIDNFKGPF